MARFIAQIIVLGGQIVGKAFAQALRQEFQAGAAAQNRARTAAEGAKQASSNSLHGMTVDESKNILNIKELDKETLQKNYDYLFKINDKKNGGSFYLQSKIFRAKERLDDELKQTEATADSNSENVKSQSSGNDAG